ncbi:LysM peptidoglycan-binding domain-containing protein [Sporosarcina sp. FSL W8-0480]|uniref:LysM peptidoglycan-binding domain-containing protein n=1 Tax=Sporosarcina sp. FSL W8-0480 TaxID=2954701 RepID=UPI0030D9C9F2
MDVHIVVKGDTLWKIARQYGIPFEDLKRVNAHLANPDYIVPGMKIFLPKKAEHKPGGKGPEKMPEKHHHQPATPPKEKPQAPKHPIPLPQEKEKPKPPATPPQMKPPVQQPPVSKPPVPPVKQQPPKLPEMPPAPPVVQPELPETPPAPPVMQPPTQPVMPPPMPPVMQQPVAPPIAMQPCFQPIMPFPCGWVPIYDADCMPIMHPGFAQPTPLPAMQMPPQQLGTPTLPAQLGVSPPLIDISEEREELEESPILPGGGMGISPNYPTSGWELTESPTMESPTENEMLNQPLAQQPYIPQMISPGFQPNQGGMLPRPQDVFGANYPWHMYCSCGCHQYPGHFQGGFYPTNMMPMPTMPMTQPMMQPMQMYPTQMHPMNMQQFYPMDNNGCGC